MLLLVYITTRKSASQIKHVLCVAFSHYYYYISVTAGVLKSPELNIPFSMSHTL